MTAGAVLAILSGGRSTRMGWDKAALGARPAEALRPLVQTVLAVGHPIPGVDAQLVPDAPEGDGPLAGIVAALRAAPAPLVLIVACDMPAVRPELAALLLEEARRQPRALATLCRSDSGLEPLLAVYRREAAAELGARLGAGVRAVHEALQGLPVLVLPPERWRAVDPRGESFTNWNRPDDMAHPAAARHNGPP